MKFQCFQTWEGECLLQQWQHKLKAATSKNKDGSPRKLRKVTNVRAARRQARKIVENKIGRKLKTNELVHHKDESRMNNSPANLEVMKGQKEHGRIHPGEYGAKKP